MSNEDERNGLKIDCRFFDGLKYKTPKDTVEWVERTAEIKGDNGEVIFEQEGCLFPSEFSKLAVDIVASKYFYGDTGNGERENSFWQLVHRVANFLSKWGYVYGYFETVDDATRFYNELCWLLLHQYAAFNSPVWFNVGLFEEYGTGENSTEPSLNWVWDDEKEEAVHPVNDYEHPQGSACFIQSVDDTLDDIMELAKKEAALFRYGSGTGTNLSSIRSCRERLSGGGVPSGPLSFMQVYDKVAGVVKSGGKTRRAAKLQILNVDHPDIMDFINCKAEEEKKAKILMANGYSYADAYATVSYQNANLSVRITDRFMDAVAKDEDWHTYWVSDKTKKGPKYKAREIFRAIADRTWASGDPGVLFDDTINTANTCKASGRINASNPCVTGDTLVATKDGMVPIVDLVDKETEIYGSDGMLHKISGAFKTGTKEVFEVTTDDGLRIKATGNHKFMTSNGKNLDTELKDLQVGDNVFFRSGSGTLGLTKITSIEKAGEEDVYDLTEPDTHHFVANGFVVHNCGELQFLDNTACNLASMNLMKFYRDGEFDKGAFITACRIVFIAQDILVDACSYPTKEICENSHKFRPLGLGYTNLGALLMVQGIPYDSLEGNQYCKNITALMTLAAMDTSIELARLMGPFEEYDKNKESVEEVLKEQLDDIILSVPDEMVVDLAVKIRDKLSPVHGVRNSQFTLLAPTGTISFMMDCTTLGIEPDIALVKFKNLVGGGTLKLVNNVVPQALEKLGYTEKEIEKIIQYIEETGGIEGAPDFKEKDLPVFDCAFPSPTGNHRSIEWKGHLNMMASAQPFLSGAISKTVNMPNSATVEDIEEAYRYAYIVGLKGVAIYRDGSKGAQVLETKKTEEKSSSTQEQTKQTTEQTKQVIRVKTSRERLPDTRESRTHKFTIGQHEGYVTAGLYPDGRVGELFITMSKEGSTIGGLVDCLSTAISMGLQYGVPLASYIKKFSYTRFEPMGFTKNEKIMTAKSPVDYIMRWLEMEFLKGDDEDVDVNVVPDLVTAQEGKTGQTVETKQTTPQQPTTAKEQYESFQSDAPTCPSCGSVTVRSGSCYLCRTCGTSLGCS